MGPCEPVAAGMSASGNPLQKPRAVMMSFAAAGVAAATRCGARAGFSTTAVAAGAEASWKLALGRDCGSGTAATAFGGGSILAIWLGASSAGRFGAARATWLCEGVTAVSLSSSSLSSLSLPKPNSLAKAANLVPVLPPLLRAASSETADGLLPRFSTSESATA